MNPKSRLNLISEIALHLQAKYNTSSINVLFGGYGIKTENVSIVNSKRIYVIDILKSQSNELILKVAKDLELNVPEVEITKETETKMNTKKKIFISHSSKDAKIVEQVIEILEGIGVKSDKIFCSSFEGYGIGLGIDFLETIKSELNNEVLVLFILSSNFYQSPVSLCEMGATWVKTSEHIPILIPPFDYRDIKGVIPNTQGMKIDDKIKMNSLKEKVESFLSLTPKNFSAWERKRDNILNTIKIILEERMTKSKEPLKPSIEQNKKTDNIAADQDSLIKELSKKEWPDNYEMQIHYIEKQRAAVEALKNHNPLDIDKEQFEKIRIEAKKEWPQDFEMQLHYEEKQVDSLRKLKHI